MNVSKQQFEKWVAEALDSLPDAVLKQVSNLVILVEDVPTTEQKRKLRLRKDYTLFGLYEGYYQALGLNVGVVEPDRITIFRQAIVGYCQTEAEIKTQIKDTLQHEIAHHFGSGEAGARRAGRRKFSGA